MTSILAFTLPALLLASSLAVTSCSKKADTGQGSNVGSTVDPSPANQPTPGSPAALAAADTTKILNEGNAALKAKDYEKAVDAALAAQQQKILTQQQSEALRNQMVQLQQDLVNAIAAGDAKAKAASQRLRQAASGSQ